MKPWTERKQIAAALKNEHVRVGDRMTGRVRLRGVYARKDFAPGDYVASFHGRIITREQLWALHESDRALFDSVNEYAVWNAASRGHLYPEDIDKLGAHLINHSCGPNARWAQYEHGALLVRAAKPIAAETEITIHYGWVGVKAAMENSRHPCACQAAFCVGTIELGVEMLDHGDGTGGPSLPPEEAARRLLADIANDTDANEALLNGYANSSADMIHGAQVLTRLDPVAFFDKLREAARAAVLAARRLQASGRKLSEHRLQQIARAYHIPEGDAALVGGDVQ